MKVEAVGEAAAGGGGRVGGVTAVLVVACCESFGCVLSRVGVAGGCDGCFLSFFRASAYMVRRICENTSSSSEHTRQDRRPPSGWEDEAGSIATVDAVIFVRSLHPDHPLQQSLSV